MKVTQKKIEARDKIFCIRNDRFRLTLGNNQGENRIDKRKITNKVGKGLQRLLSLTKQDLLNLIEESPEKLNELLEEFLGEIPSSTLYSQQVQENLHTILGTISKYCLLPGTNFVVADTVKRVREHVPLSKRGHQGFVGLSRDRRNGTPSETIENNLRPLKLPKPLSKGERRAKNDPDYYERWANRENKDETPFDFLERVWGDYIRAGLLYQTDLRGGQRKNKNSDVAKLAKLPKPLAKGEQRSKDQPDYYERWANRENKTEPLLEFLDDLRVAKPALDKRLFDVLFAECKKQGKHLAEFVPTKSDEVDNRFKLIESKVSEFSTNRSKVRHYSFSYRSKSSSL
jgi:hypothetical protein